MHYPFIPKSNKNITAGDYWLIQLSNESFSVAIVIDVPPPELKLSREIIVALLDYNKKLIPEISDLKNAKIIGQGHVHIKTIEYSGNELIGNLDLEKLNISPLEMIDLDNLNDGNFAIMVGYRKKRDYHISDRKVLETCGYWGYDYIQLMAEKIFVEKNEDWL